MNMEDRNKLSIKLCWYWSDTNTSTGIDIWIGRQTTNSFLCGSCRRTLADIIMEKITEKQTEVGTVMSEVSGCPMPQLDPRVTEVYRGVGKVSLLQAHHASTNWETN